MFYSINPDFPDLGFFFIWGMKEFPFQSTYANRSGKNPSSPFNTPVTNITRVLYFFVVDKKIVLTNGFVKKTQKTPRKEIERAKRELKDYKRRHPDE